MVRTARTLLLLLALPSAGCHRYASVPTATPELTDPVELRVGTGTLRMHRPALDGDSILAGWVRSTSGHSALPVHASVVEHGDSSLVRLRLPLHASIRELDVARTAILTLGVTTLALATGFFLSLSYVGS